MRPFVELMRKRRKVSLVVLALDLAERVYRASDVGGARKALMKRAVELVGDLSWGLAALKLNYPMVLALDPLEIRGLVRWAKEKLGLPAIADFKLADIDRTNVWVARHAFDLGFDAVIAHLFTGAEGSVKELVDEARTAGKGVIGVVYMSHPGASLLFERTYPELARLAVELGLDGVVAPATRPEVLGDVRRLVGPETLIFAPGVGAQGGRAAQAVEAGADFVIVGRSLYEASNSKAALASLLKALS